MDYNRGGGMTARVARLTIGLSKSEHKRLKTAASLMGTTMKDLVLISVDNFLHGKPNKVTLKAMKQSENGKGLRKFRNMDELFQDLGI